MHESWLKVDLRLYKLIKNLILILNGLLSRRKNLIIKQINI